MASCEQDATSCLPLANDMAGSWCAQYAVLAYEQLLYSVRSTNLCNLLDDLRVIVSAISANDEECSFCTFRYREKDRCDKGFAVVFLLEDCDLLAQSRGTGSASLSEQVGV